MLVTGQAENAVPVDLDGLEGGTWCEGIAVAFKNVSARGDARAIAFASPPFPFQVDRQ